MQVRVSINQSWDQFTDFVFFHGINDNEKNTEYYQMFRLSFKTNVSLYLCFYELI